MRVTQGMLSNNMLRNLMNSQSKMDTYLEQLYTGKKISRPSDDPVIAMKGMNYRGQVIEVEQYKRNIGEAHNWMDNSDAALDKATQAMQRLSELAVQASNSTNDKGARKSISKEAEQLQEHLIDIANTKVNGKFIFNGTNTNQNPIDDSDSEEIVIEHNTDQVRIEVFNGTKLQVNIDVSEVFDGSFFEDIDLFITELNEDSDSGVSIGKFKENIDKIIDKRAELGARMNRLELVESRLEELEIITTKTMSDNEDIHFEEAITNLITQESLHRAALASG